MTEQIYAKVLTEYYADGEELVELAQRLRRDLLETQVDDVQFSSGSALPQGAKSAATIDWSTLLITLAGSTSVLVPMIGVMVAWIKRHEGTYVELDLPGKGSIVVSGRGVSEDNLSRMITLLEDAEEGVVPPVEDVVAPPVESDDVPVSAEESQAEDSDPIVY